MSCDCCAHALQFPDSSVKKYSMGCNWCAARYLQNGGEDDVSKWAKHYGINLAEINELRTQGELVDPALKRRGKS